MVQEKTRKNGTMKLALLANKPLLQMFSIYNILCLCEFENDCRFASEPNLARTIISAQDKLLRVLTISMRLTRIYNQSANQLAW